MQPIIEIKVENSILEYFLKLQKPHSSDLSEFTCTKNRNQTPNIVKLVDLNLISHLKKIYFIPSINKIKGNYNFRDINVDHIHHIVYKSQFQL